MRRWIVIMVLLPSCAWPGAGCQQQKRVSTDPLGAAPTDFALELTILTPPPALSAATAPATMPATAVHLRQSRYVLFADGSLYQGDDPEHAKGADWLPPLTRVLTRRQVAEVWTLAQQLGFTDPDKSSGATNFKLASPPENGRVMYLATFGGWGHRWTFARPCTEADPDPAMTQLVRELAQMAWSSDLPAAAGYIMPKRYEFGPDPYARYRQTGGAPAATTRPGAQ